MRNLGFNRYLIFILSLSLLYSCTVTKLQTEGSYIHKFEGGHSKQIIIINDSLLSFKNNVSMMHLDISIPYELENNQLNISQNFKDTLDVTSQLIYPSAEIKIANQRTLIMDNLVFKFKKEKHWE